MEQSTGKDDGEFMELISCYRQLQAEHGLKAHACLEAIDKLLEHGDISRNAFEKCKYIYYLNEHLFVQDQIREVLENELGDSVNIDFLTFRIYQNLTFPMTERQREMRQRKIDATEFDADFIVFNCDEN